VEGDIDAGERNRSKATLKDNIALSLLFLKCAIVAAIHDVLQHLFNLRETKFLGQLRVDHQYNNSKLFSDTYLANVNFLYLEVIEDIRESLQCDKLPCADILLTLTSISVTACQNRKSLTDLDIEVDDL
jgi:hypothetical protein